MNKLIKPINPFGNGCEPISECTDAIKEWLIETGKATEADFIIEVSETKKEKSK
jgi:hypothetical protein